MTRSGARTHLIPSMVLALAATTAFALEPPTTEQLERYRQDGSLAARASAARAFGNHRMAPQLASGFGAGAAATKALPDGPTVLPAAGSPRVLTLLLAFADMPGFTDPAVVDRRIYGDGDPAMFPYESLTNFYRRSSYDRLEITGSTLGWYTTQYPRADVTESSSGREALIREALAHYDGEGHDFSQYDNDGDGVVDYLVVVWTGAHGEWAEFWWGYQTRFRDQTFVVDGVRFGTYSWQWENYSWPGPFSPEVVIHETGHALGLPDYYDYDDAVGPRGGVGGLDQMDSNWGDHNAFSKWVLGWLTPEIYNEGLHDIGLMPSAEEPEAAVFMHGNPVSDPFNEFYIVQVRNQGGNDRFLPRRGTLIWHVDARLDGNGNFLYDNSYTEHKLLRLMEADGLEEIEQGGRADAGDFFHLGDVFDNDSFPNSNRYDGVPTNISIDEFGIGWASEMMIFTADLGSGCALWCDASVGTTAWPGLPVAFSGTLQTANCQGPPSYVWDFGDGTTSGESDTSHAYVSAGRYVWHVAADYGDAWCGHTGSVLVCTDFPCWQWMPLAPMRQYRAGHAAVELTDGRVLVAGGGPGNPEIFDPNTGVWTDTPATQGGYGWARGALLDDGRVLLVGSTNYDGDVDSEVYDPASNAWTLTGQLNHDRTAHSAVKLADGRVLVAGGVFGTYVGYEDVEEVEVFDPASETWSVIGAIDGRLLMPAMARLSDDRILIVGGHRATFFDPRTDTLGHATVLPAEWTEPLAVPLADGSVLLAGISSSTLTLTWNPADGRWRLVGPLSTIRSGATITNLATGLVLVTGGADLSGTPLQETEFYDPATRSWASASDLTEARAYHTATSLSDGQLIMIGGYSRSTGAPGDMTVGVEALTRPMSPPRRIGGRAVP